MLLVQLKSRFVEEKNRNLSKYPIRKDFKDVALKSEGYLMAGYIIHNAEKDVGFQVQVLNMIRI